VKPNPYDEINAGYTEPSGSSKTMTDAALCALIDRERDNGIGANDQMQSDREAAMQFYNGEAIGKLAPPEVEGRSRVVSKDLMDTVEWMMPSLMRMFAGTDDVVRFEPTAQGDEQNCTDATEYCGYILHRKNEGFTVLHDAIKSCLITRMGIVKVYCDRSWATKEEAYTGLTVLELQALQSDSEITVDEVTEVQQVAGINTIGNGYLGNIVPPMMADPAQGQMAMGQPQASPVTFDVKVSRKKRKDEFVVEGVPPEEITMSKDNRDVGKLRYIGHDVERTMSDLRSIGYPDDKIDALPDDKQANMSSEASSRGDLDGVNDYDDDPADESQRKVTVTEAYLLVDYDKDGIAEYRRVVKAGSTVFENEVVAEHPFALFTPVLMPYKLIGMSFHDLVEDIQRIKTAITRQLLDNMYLSNTPRTEVVEGQVNLDDFLSPTPGGVVRVRQAGMMREIVPVNIGAQAQAGLEYFNQVRDGRTGVKEFSQGLVGNELSQSQIGSQGVAQLADAAAQRMELVARVLAETGIKRLYKLILKLATTYQDREQQIKINGHWMQIDPRAWSTDYDMVVSVGVGTSSKDRQLQQLQTLIALQAQAAQYGLVQPQNGYNAIAKLCEAMGYKDASQFFTPPDPNAPPPQAPDPNAAAMAKVQAESQARMAEMQQQGQLQAAKQQGDIEVERMKQAAQAQQAQAETELEAQRNAAQMQNDMALAQFKAEKDAELARYKAELAQQTAIEVARINAAAKVEAAAAQGAKDASGVSSFVGRENDLDGGAA
jgi:hypothetical protein